MAEIYVPVLAESPKDLKIRYSLLEAVRVRGLTPGFMMLITPQGLTQAIIQKQLENLNYYAKLPKPLRPTVFGMHPNIPIIGTNKFNFLTNPNYSEEYVQRSIELMSQLPSELTPKTGRALSFHLNTLITSDVYIPPNRRIKAFENILERIKRIVGFGKRLGVTVAIETTPIPEFGDIARCEKTLLENGKHWVDLINPWPLLFWRDEITKLRSVGAALVIDFCHSFTALRFIQTINSFPSDQQKLFMRKYMLEQADLKSALSVADFADLVLQNTQSGDIWHVNDAKGIYKDPEFNELEAQFKEGVTLYEGDIPTTTLDRLIKEGIQRSIKFVLEINEVNFNNNPKTSKSLALVLNHIHDNKS